MWEGIKNYISHHAAGSDVTSLCGAPVCVRPGIWECGMAGSLASSCVRVDPRSLSGAVSEPMHLLPCQIQREGAANVKGYFAPAVKDREGGKEVSFRGRTLKGQEVSVPSGYMGVVLREDQKPCSEEEDRLFTVKSTFRSFTQWNLETPPSADDVLIMSLIWPKIAAAIHAPVE
ncbi:ribonuclease H2 subunit C isoform X1 [Xenopus tropicalis]|uniref:Ribonuclease H2 subunit C n=1 Tax=Xenopus tropicalis TaxID=8364 RepID=A0A803J6P0_XENTR|nr:ribonuclease H2 subunit C isoform X1 [Xenopus tropicalis]